MRFYNGNFEAFVIHVAPILSFLMTLTILKASTCDEGVPGSVVGIATAYGLDGPGIESQPPVQWVPGLSRGQGAARA